MLNVDPIEKFVKSTLWKNMCNKKKEEKELRLKVKLRVLKESDYRKIIWIIWIRKGDAPSTKGTFTRQAYRGTEAGPVPLLIVWTTG